MNMTLFSTGWSKSPLLSSSYAVTMTMLLQKKRKRTMFRAAKAVLDKMATPQYDHNTQKLALDINVIARETYKNTRKQR